MADEPTAEKQADPRVKALAARLEEIAQARHPSRRQWALATGVHPTQLSHFLNGNAGVSMERFLDLLRSAGAMLLIEEADEARPLRIGTIDGTGRLMSDIKLLQLPGSATFTGASFGPFKAGDEVTFAACSEYMAGRWLLVEVGGDRLIFKAETIDDTAHLVNAGGDEIRFRLDRHHVVGVITSRRETM